MVLGPLYFWAVVISNPVNLFYVDNDKGKIGSFLLCQRSKDACLISQFNFHFGMWIYILGCSFQCNSFKLKWKYVLKHECMSNISFYYVLMHI